MGDISHCLGTMVEHCIFHLPWNGTPNANLTWYRICPEFIPGICLLDLGVKVFEGFYFVSIMGMYTTPRPPALPPPQITSKLTRIKPHWESILGYVGVGDVVCFHTLTCGNLV